MNKKLQAVLEDTLLKNITLKVMLVIIGTKNLSWGISIRFVWFIFIVGSTDH